MVDSVLKKGKDAVTWERRLVRRLILSFELFGGETGSRGGLLIAKFIGDVSKIQRVDASPQWRDRGIEVANMAEENDTRRTNVRNGKNMEVDPRCSVTREEVGGPGCWDVAGNCGEVGDGQQQHYF